VKDLIPHRGLFRGLLGILLVGLVLGCGGCGSEDGGERASSAAAREGGSGDGGSERAAVREENGAADEDGDAAGGAAGGEAGAARAKRPLDLDVAPVERGRLVHAVTAEGRLKARKDAEIKTELTGTVERLLVREGDRVQAGDLIAVFDQREYQASLAEARARHLSALSELAVNLELELAGQVDEEAHTDYQTQLAKLRDSLRAGHLTHEEFGRRSLALELEALRAGAFRREVLEARTGFADARAAEERARLNLERTEIRAPFAGTITDLAPVLGERLYSGEPICRLVNTRDLEAEVYVLESDLGSLAVGYPALLTITAVGQTFPVKVSVVSPHVDTDSRTCRVLFQFENDSGRVRPGMFVRAQIATQMLEDRLLVPKEAVLFREGRPLLFKVAGSQALWVYVQTGEQNEHYYEITGCAAGQTLEAGDRVVVSDHLTLAHEAQIKVRKTMAVENPWKKNFPAEEG